MIGERFRRRPRQSLREINHGFAARATFLHFSPEAGSPNRNVRTERPHSEHSSLGPLWGEVKSGNVNLT